MLRVFLDINVWVNCTLGSCTHTQPQDTGWSSVHSDNQMHGLEWSDVVASDVVASDEVVSHDACAPWIAYEEAGGVYLSNTYGLSECESRCCQQLQSTGQPEGCSGTISLGPVHGGSTTLLGGPCTPSLA